MDKNTENNLLLQIIESQNHRKFGLEETFKDQLVPKPLLWVGTSFPRSGCSKPLPI